jgi:DNA-binding Xre family transcriptional regulator
MTPKVEISHIEIADEIGGIRRRLAVVGAALDGLSPMCARHPAFGGLEEICHELDLQLGAILKKLVPELAE